MIYSGVVCAKSNMPHQKLIPRPASPLQVLTPSIIIIPPRRTPRVSARHWVRLPRIPIFAVGVWLIVRDRTDHVPERTVAGTRLMVRLVVRPACTLHTPHRAVATGRTMVWLHWRRPGSWRRSELGRPPWGHRVGDTADGVAVRTVSARGQWPAAIRIR